MIAPTAQKLPTQSAEQCEQMLVNQPDNNQEAQLNTVQMQLAELTAKANEVEHCANQLEDMGDNDVTTQAAHAKTQAASLRATAENVHFELAGARHSKNFSSSRIAALGSTLQRTTNIADAERTAIVGAIAEAVKHSPEKRQMASNKSIVSFVNFAKTHSIKAAPVIAVGIIPPAFPAKVINPFQLPTPDLPAGPSMLESALQTVEEGAAQAQQAAQTYVFTPIKTFGQKAIDETLTFTNNSKAWLQTKWHDGKQWLNDAFTNEEDTTEEKPLTKQELTFRSVTSITSNTMGQALQQAFSLTLPAFPMSFSSLGQSLKSQEIPQNNTFFSRFRLFN